MENAEDAKKRDFNRATSPLILSPVGDGGEEDTTVRPCLGLKIVLVFQWLAGFPGPIGIAEFDAFGRGRIIGADDCFGPTVGRRGEFEITELMIRTV